MKSIIQVIEAICNISHATSYRIPKRVYVDGSLLETGIRKEYIYIEGTLSYLVTPRMKRAFHKQRS